MVKILARSVKNFNDAYLDSYSGSGSVNPSKVGYERIGCHTDLAGSFFKRDVGGVMSVMAVRNSLIASFISIVARGLSEFWEKAAGQERPSKHVLFFSKIKAGLTAWKETILGRISKKGMRIWCGFLMMSYQIYYHSCL